MSAESAALIWKLREKHGWLFFADTPIDTDDLKVPEPVKEFKDDKSKSQRLRNTLFVYWKQMSKAHKTEVDSETFYNQHMEKLIQQIKERLEPE
jgi:alpha/beta superfamily hydrolase